MWTLIDRFQTQENLHRIEGRQGVITLARLARALGYKDPQYFGQLDSKCSIGDLIEFLEDNSGAIEAVIDWVCTQRNKEWEASLKDIIGEDVDEDEG